MIQAPDEFALEQHEAHGPDDGGQKQWLELRRAANKLAEHHACLHRFVQLREDAVRRVVMRVHEREVEMRAGG